MPKVQGGSAKQGDDAVLMSLALSEGECEQPMTAPAKCVECRIDIDATNLSFEQKLVKDEDFCRRCWDRVMDDTDDIRLPSLNLGCKLFEKARHH